MTHSPSGLNRGYVSANTSSEDVALLSRDGLRLPCLRFVNEKMGMWQWYRENFEMGSSSWDPHHESESHHSVWRDTQRGMWYGMKVRVSRPGWPVPLEQSWVLCDGAGIPRDGAKMLEYSRLCPAGQEVQMEHLRTETLGNSWIWGLMGSGWNNLPVQINQEQTYLEPGMLANS